MPRLRSATKGVPRPAPENRYEWSDGEDDAQEAHDGIIPPGNRPVVVSQFGVQGTASVAQFVT